MIHFKEDNTRITISTKSFSLFESEEIQLLKKPPKKKGEVVYLSSHGDSLFDSAGRFLNVATRRPFFGIYRARAPDSQNPNPKGILVIYYIFDSNEPSPMEAVQILNRTLRLNRIKC